MLIQQQEKVSINFILYIKTLKKALFVNYTFHIDQEFDKSNATLKTNLVTRKDVGFLITAGGGSVTQ